MHHSMGEAVIFGLTLIWEIALGVGIAIVVSALIWPVRMSDTLKRDLEHQFSLVADHLTGIARAYARDSTVATSSLRELVGKLLNNRSRLTAAAQHERYLYNENYDDLEARVVTVNRTVTIL
ncbi:MAG: FUSC family protein, partial [Planctomycetes bacterium]|nr:FUSC family protein [Planctomycetota bacterium]